MRQFASRRVETMGIDGFHIGAEWTLLLAIYFAQEARIPWSKPDEYIAVDAEGKPVEEVPIFLRVDMPQAET